MRGIGMGCGVGGTEGLRGGWGEGAKIPGGFPPDNAVMRLGLAISLGSSSIRICLTICITRPMSATRQKRQPFPSSPPIAAQVFEIHLRLLLSESLHST